uniref:beta strand repeat-containing protein n=1 Tax=Nevskia sp. TaxID=1929292 RepID=UPI0025DB4527
MTRAGWEQANPATPRRRTGRLSRLLAATLAAAALLTAPAQAAVRQVYALGQHSNEARLSSNEGAVRAADGTIYFISSGRLNDGTALSARAPDGRFTTLHWFQQRARNLAGDTINDLLNPRGTPIIASDGNLYGVGAAGGANGQGGVYRYRLSGPDAGEYRVIHSFTFDQGCNPLAGVIEGSDGDLYGTTSACGAPSNRGSVFRLSKAGTLTVLKNFATPATAADGQLPQAALVQGADGAYYGTTSQAGTDPNGGGTVFRVTSTGSFATLHSFAGDTGLQGGRPQGALALGDDSNLYGTTTVGGQPDPSRGRVALGTIFRITPAGGFTSLYTFLSDPFSPGFTPAVTGTNPVAGLTRGGDGNFYGVTSGGGALNSDAVGCRGSIYRVTPAGAVTTLFCFRTHFLDGIDPAATLTLGGDGQLYGTTTGAGAVPAGTTPNNPAAEAAFGWGTAFRISTAGAFTRILTASSLPSEGRTPSGPLLQGADGLFYGVTAGQTSKGFPGTVYSVSADGVLRTLHSFNFGSNAGAAAESALVIGPDGAFYGTTSAGGSNGLGAVFRISAAGDFTTLHSFPGGANGSQPRSALTLGSDGNFYGSTEAGGSGTGSGTLFRITPAGSHTRLHSFDLASTGNQPRGRLIQASDGNFYGTTTSFGSGNAGTVFRMTPAGAVSVLHAFAGAPSEGASPFGGVTQGADGALYGTTVGGGSTNAGTVFRLTLAGAYSTLYTFRTGSPVIAGESPQSPLLLARDGNFYGTAANVSFGDSRGVVYRITPQGRYTIVHQSTSLVNEDGLEDEPIQAADGRFYLPTRSDGDGLHFGSVLAIDGPADRVTALSSGAGIGSVTLSWPVAVGAVSYNVYQSTTPGGQGSTPVVTGITAAGQTGGTTLNGLSGGTAYYFTITAVNALGETQFSNETSATPTAAAPTVTIAASPTSLVLGAATSLSWSSTNATACTASGDWSGSRATSGSTSVTPAAVGTATYTLRCTGTGGTADATATVTVDPLPAPP